MTETERRDLALECLKLAGGNIEEAREMVAFVNSYDEFHTRQKLMRAFSIAIDELFENEPRWTGIGKAVFKALDPGQSGESQPAPDRSSSPTQPASDPAQDRQPTHPEAS